MTIPIGAACSSNRGQVSRRGLIALAATLAVTPPAFAAKRSSPAESTPKPKPAPLPERPAFSAQEQQKAEVPGFAGARFFASSEDDYARAIPAEPGPWLVLSSGAEDGAYGAGFLTGWTASGQRPDFSLVTGVSSGAIIAVYAFAGAKYDSELRQVYTGVHASDIFELRGTPESMADTWPLQQMIDKKVTAELLGDVAAQHRRGRRLFVATTNLDAGRPMVWDMGAIAVKGGEQGLALFRKVVLASASVPGAFPPVFVEAEANGRRFQEMHVDGGVNGPMYLAPETYLLSTRVRRLPPSELYVIVNGKVASEFSQTDRTIPHIVGRSFSLALKLGARMQLFLFAQMARRHSIPMKVAAVEPDFSYAEQGLFDPHYMKALFEHGFECGRRGEFQS